jgi:hypothetical protein
MTAAASGDEYLRARTRINRRRSACGGIDDVNLAERCDLDRCRFPDRSESTEAAGALLDDTQPPRPRTARSPDYIDRHYAQPLDVPTMARAALMSPAHFSRKFRATYGETP